MYYVLKIQFLNKHNIPLIILDDYKHREYYQIIEKFWNVRIIGRFAVLEGLIKNDSKEFITKYILDCR